MTISVLGAGGTLGRAFVNFLLKDNKVIAIDCNEWSIASMKNHPNLTKIVDYMGNVRIKADLHIVCSCWKHIEVCEENTFSSWMNNFHQYELFLRNNKGNVIYISSDKAVEPICVYGRQKMYAEKLTIKNNGIVVRMGNIIASSGSTIPIWEEQIRNNDPLTISDWRMKRYWIGVEEAVEKIMSLLPLAKPGNIIVPKCELMTLREIVEAVLKFHHLKQDYPIKLVGKKKIEKYVEKLHWDTERAIKGNENGLIYH